MRRGTGKSELLQKRTTLGDPEYAQLEKKRLERLCQREKFEVVTHKGNWILKSFAENK